MVLPVKSGVLQIVQIVFSVRKNRTTAGGSSLTTRVDATALSVLECLGTIISDRLRACVQACGRVQHTKEYSCVMVTNEFQSSSYGARRENGCFRLWKAMERHQVPHPQPAPLQTPAGFLNYGSSEEWTS